MSATFYLVTVIMTVVGLSFFLWRVGRAYLMFRGKRLVTCPETREHAAVDVDIRHAALTAALGQPSFRLSDCSRWPDRHDCGQACLKQIQVVPADCLVRTILMRWYEGKSCVLCGKDLGHIDWLHKPALMTLERRTFEWHEIRPETIPETLTTHLPVCWNCHIAETFRRQYPDLIVDRPWKSTRGGQDSS